MAKRLESRAPGGLRLWVSRLTLSSRPRGGLASKRSLSSWGRVLGASTPRATPGSPVGAAPRRGGKPSAEPPGCQSVSDLRVGGSSGWLQSHDLPALPAAGPLQRCASRPRPRLGAFLECPRGLRALWACPWGCRHSGLCMAGGFPLEGVGAWPRYALLRGHRSGAWRSWGYSTGPCESYGATFAAQHPRARACTVLAAQVCFVLI